MLKQLIDYVWSGGTSPADAELYAVVAREVVDDRLDPGLWVKAFAASDGVADKARARYIEMRVKQLKSVRAALLREQRTEQQRTQLAARAEKRAFSSRLAAADQELRRAADAELQRRLADPKTRRKFQRRDYRELAAWMLAAPPTIAGIILLGQLVSDPIIRQGAYILIGFLAGPFILYGFVMLIRRFLFRSERSAL